jgi:peptidoglycan/xylan/chitin deacetylase (PgdA/CDA1 family)
MTWSEIQDLDAEGFEMAAHSQYHTDVSTTTVDRARIEIFGAKSDLESHLGHTVVDWAYPYGGVSVASARLVGAAGYWSGVTTQPGSWHDPKQVLYLSRVRIGGADTLQALINGVSKPPSATPTVH